MTDSGSHDDTKQYCEKLYVAADQSYPLAIGGAGIQEVIEAIAQEVSSRVASQKPPTASDLEETVRKSIAYVHKHDIPVSAWKKQCRTSECLIVAKPPNEAFVILRVVGKRVYRETEPTIIGWNTALNKALLKRLYRPELPMQQAVMLAIYLVSWAKQLYTSIGYETRVAVVTANGAWLDDSEYVANTEVRIDEFRQLTDRLFLNSIDMSIAPSAFGDVLTEFSRDVAAMRQRYMDWSAAHYLRKAMTDPNYRGEPYPKLFPGANASVHSSGAVAVREDTPEEIAEHRRIFQAMRAGNAMRETQKLQEMIAGRTPLYTGEETIQIYGTAGPVPEGEDNS